MKSLQVAIAVLMVLLATGSAVALATEPAPVPAPEPAGAPATWPEVQFAVIADPHICNPYIKVGENCDSYKHDVKPKRLRLEAVVTAIHKRGHAQWIVSLGDAVDDLYRWYFLLFPAYHKYRASARWYWKYITCDTCGRLPHYLVLGNHDIRDYAKGKIYREHAKGDFRHWAAHYKWQVSKDPDRGFYRGGLVPAAYLHKDHAPWYFWMLHSGEVVNSVSAGSCVRFNSDQLAAVNKFLEQESLPDKSVILFWHVSPESEIRGTAKKICNDTSSGYLKILKDHAPKIKATFTGHTHIAKSYIWNTADGSLRDQVFPGDYDANPTRSEEIMMFTVPSTGDVSPLYDPDIQDLFFEVSLHANGNLSIDNKQRIGWTVLGSSEPPAPIFGESSYTQVDPCFEQDNDGDGWFNDDKIDCPNGTDLGTELDYDSDRQAFTIGAELRQSCKVRDFTPGEYYAVSNAQTGKTALEKLTISQRYDNCTNRTPPISELDPEPAGGGVALVATGPDGAARQIANASTRDYTDQASGISVVSIDQHHDSLTEAHLQNVPAGYDLRLYVKFRPGMLGEFLTEGSSCDADTYLWLDHEDPAFAEDFALEVVDNNAPPAPTLSRPADGASSTCDSIPGFAWDPASEATAYQIQVDDDEDFSSAAIDSKVSGASFTPAASLPAGGYHWRVRAAYDCGHGSWSSTWSFKQLDCIHLPLVMREN